MTPWTPEQTWLLRQLRATSTLEQLADALGRTVGSVKARLKTEGIRQGKRKRWSPADIEALRTLWPDHTAAEIKQQLGHTCSSIYQRAAKLGLEKSAEFKAIKAHKLDGKIGAASRFQKGSAPFNKGAKGWQAGGRAVETQFRKGQRPHTWKPIGTEVIDPDGYLKRKVTESGYPPRDWRMVHVLLWEEHNGPVPAGHTVVFRDRNRTHIELANLELITRRELMARNTVHNLPQPLKRLIRAKARLTRVINEVSREKQS